MDDDFSDDLDGFLEDNLQEPSRNRVQDFQEMEDKALSEYIMACLIVEDTIGEDCVVIALDENGKFYAYLDETNEQCDWDSDAIGLFVASVELVCLNNSGL